MGITSATYYRPERPPRVTTTDLASFVEQACALGVIGRALPTLNVRYGPGIDADDEPAEWMAWQECIGGTRDSQWKMAEGGRELEHAVESLRGRSLAIYRADITIGLLDPQVVTAVSRITPDGNGENLKLSKLSLRLGPITLDDDEKGTSFHVGWIGLEMSGGGDLYPCTASDVVARLNACDEIAALKALCETMWPVEIKPPSPALVAARRQMGDLWVGTDFDAPVSWRWAIQEGSIAP